MNFPVSSRTQLSVSGNRATAIRLILGCLFIILPVVVTPAIFGQETEQQTVTEEPASMEEALIQQLSELRQEIRTLRREVGQLRRMVNEIHRVAVRPKTPPQPAAPKEVNLDDDPVLGSAEAKVAIVEFSDFQCSFCRRFHLETFTRIKESYIDTGRVQYIFRDFPLTSIHPLALEASIAAECAGRQDSYWEMHHALFTNQARLGPELYPELAGELKLDLEAFASCLQDPTVGEEIQADRTYGQSLGIRGTPHYFVGRIEGDHLVQITRISGAQAFPGFQKVIDSLLK